LNKCPIPGGPKTRWIVFGAFIFFLLKGLVWIALGLLAWAKYF
jgi:hypothetical protein